MLVAQHSITGEWYVIAGSAGQPTFTRIPSAAITDRLVAKVGGAFDEAAGTLTNDQLRNFERSVLDERG